MSSNCQPPTSVSPPTSTLVKIRLALLQVTPLGFHQPKSHTGSPSKREVSPRDGLLRSGRCSTQPTMDMISLPFSQTPFTLLETSTSPPNKISSTSTPCALTTSCLELTQLLESRTPDNTDSPPPPEMDPSFSLTTTRLLTTGESTLLELTKDMLTFPEVTIKSLSSTSPTTTDSTLRPKCRDQERAHQPLSSEDGTCLEMDSESIHLNIHFY